MISLLSAQQTTDNGDQYKKDRIYLAFYLPSFQSLRKILRNIIENMQLTQINIAFSLVFLLVHSIKADLRRCADFEPEIDVNGFASQNELEQMFDSFNGTNTEQVVELIQLMQNIEADETNGENFISSAKLLRNVVSLMNVKRTKKCTI